MKKLLALPFMVALLTSFIACKKEPKYTTRYDQMLSSNAGTVSAKINGIVWPFSSFAINFTTSADPTDNTFDIQTDVFDNDKLRYQTLLIGGISRLIKTDTLITGLKFHTTSTSSPDRYVHPHAEFILGGEDYSETSYDLLRDSSNAISVIAYDVQTKNIKGNFHFTLVRTQGQQSQKAPDTLKFTDGQFDLKINETP